MTQKFCKKCLLKELDAKSYHELIEKNLEILKPEDRAEPEKTNQRLALCRECEKLNAGTCLSCGCYVEIRAALKKGRCPNKKWM